MGIRVDPTQSIILCLQKILHNIKNKFTRIKSFLFIFLNFKVLVFFFYENAITKNI